MQTNWRLELVDILGAVAAETPNLKLMIRPCAPPRKCRRCLEIVREHPTAPSLPVWVMAEVPSVAYWIPPTRRWVSRVSIRNIDLTQLTLGVDRDSTVCAELFDEADLAVTGRHQPDHPCPPRRRHHRGAVWAGPVQIFSNTPNTSSAWGSARSR